MEIITDVNKGIDELTDGIVAGTGDTIKGIAHGLQAAAADGVGHVVGGAEVLGRKSPPQTGIFFNKNMYK